MKAIYNTGKIMFLILSFFTLSFFTFSQVTNISPAPHGGQMKEAAGNYFIELLLSREKAYVFLLDPSVNAINNKEISGGNAIFQLFDSTFVTSNLVPYLADGFMLQGAVPQFAKCTVEFILKGTTISAIFTGKPQELTVH
jgi:hypothetical protein